MIRLVVAIAALVAFTEVGQAQLLNQAGKDSPEQATKILPELAGKTTLHFHGRSLYFTDGTTVVEFRLGDGSTLKLKLPSPIRWSLSALQEPAQPVVIVVKRKDEEQSFEIVRNSPLEKRLIELLQADLMNNKHSPDDAKIIGRMRETLRSRQLSQGEIKGVEILLEFYRDPSSAPPESREFIEAWRKSLTSKPAHPPEPATDPDSDEAPTSPAR